MWVVAKYKTNEFFLLKGNLQKKFGPEVQFYLPKIKFQRYKKNKFIDCEKRLLGDYVFCFHKKFSENQSISLLNNLKGIKYILESSKIFQKEIENFITRCKKHENKGYITQNFFNYILNKKNIFISGPFTNMVFKILEERKNKLRVLIGGIKTTIEKGTENLYQPI